MDEGARHAGEGGEGLGAGLIFGALRDLAGDHCRPQGAFGAAADPNNLIPESDKSNNANKLAITVK